MSAEAITIRVRAKASDNYARVLGHKVAASCTACPKQAAKRAAEKYFGAQPFTLRETKRGDVVSELRYEYVAERQVAP